MNNQLKGYHDLTQAEIGGVHRIRSGVVHIAGHHVQVGTRVRQLCGWCGEPLLDYTLDRLAVPEGQTPQPRTWSPGHLVEMTEVEAWQVGQVGQHGDRLPANACTAQLDG